MIRYLALGDSYTIGEGIEAAGRWPVLLAARLREAGIAIAEPRILAKTGWTTDELAAAMDAAEPLGDRDFVSLLIGVNNQYRGRSVDNYREEFAALLQRAIALTRQRAARVLVLSIPDWGVTPFARRELRSPRRIAQELDAYNATARELCAAAGVAFVDITAISRSRTDDMLAEDGLHPSATQYARWADAALPVAQGLLAATA
ncbi:MAG: SGNH/GDSL hydrolase family protein [Xanthomonadaceae bacterium]|nr:SGNH/GDSL hydrolase family protein [Xanthomonadaceae bacterium]